MSDDIDITVNLLPPAQLTVAIENAQGLAGAPGRKGDTGETGPPGRDGSTGTTFEYQQSAPANVWVIVHGLNKFPSITVVTSAGDIVEGSDTYNSANQVTLEFSSPFSGTAYLN